MLSDVGSIINQIMQGSFRSILCDPKYNERAQGNETFEVGESQARRQGGAGGAAAPPGKNWTSEKISPLVPCMVAW